MQQELEIDPSNAGSEYVLGALAQQNEQWDEAIPHFSRAAKLDPSFGDAFLDWEPGLGSAKRYSERDSTLGDGRETSAGKSGSTLFACDRLQPDRAQRRRRQAICHSKTIDSERRCRRRQSSTAGEAELALRLFETWDSSHGFYCEDRPTPSESATRLM